ncbi:MAG: hypothetical protein WC214_05305, partial [Candidatus Omnitrophota bacterium]
TSVDSDIPISMFCGIFIDGSSKKLSVSKLEIFSCANDILIVHEKNVINIKIKNLFIDYSAFL